MSFYSPSFPSLHLSQELGSTGQSTTSHFPHYCSTIDIASANRSIRPQINWPLAMIYNCHRLFIFLCSRHSQQSFSSVLSSSFLLLFLFLLLLLLLPFCLISAEHTSCMPWSRMIWYQQPVDFMRKQNDDSLNFAIAWRDKLIATQFKILSRVV